MIPLCIRLESDDYQALDLLSTPKAIVVSLKRRIKYQSDPERFLGSLVKDTIDYSQPAVWWPSSEGIEDNVGRFRFLNGELHLKVDMKPTSGIGDFAIEVCNQRIDIIVTVMRLRRIDVFMMTTAVLCRPLPFQNRRV